MKTEKYVRKLNFMRAKTFENWGTDFKILIKTYEGLIKSKIDSGLIL